MEEANAKILIVDDNRINRQVLTLLLQELYPHIDQAADGSECLTALSENAFDLVLLDLNMPNKSGFEVLKQSHEFWQNQPRTDGEFPPVFLVVSADNDPDSINRAFQLGASDYITTPFNREELLARVSTHLRLRYRELFLEECVAIRTAELQSSKQALIDTQSQLILAEKMASLGQMAAGIGHEINNPVGYIQSNLESLQCYMSDIKHLLDKYEQTETLISDPEQRHQLQEMRQSLRLDFLKEDIDDLISDSLTGAQRVKQIVSDLKIFSHPEGRNWERLDLKECLKGVLNIVHGEAKYKTTIKTDLADNLLPIECIVPQIYQVITNLIVNAIQAIEARGNITIKAHPFESNSVKITITDDGKGMPSEVLKKIFDPFFTTKAVGEGTGLGLSVSYSIVEAHRGSITVNSQEGVGTCFTLILPIKQRQSPKLSIVPTA
jgi:two-component system, NtrC family, sensor kinase